MNNSVEVPLSETETLKVTAFSQGVTAFDLLGLNVRAYIYELRTRQEAHQTLPINREMAKMICKTAKTAPSSNQLIKGDDT